ncbi:hypothetical protein ACFPRL_15280 [Pseudoclavibacter helvolus]
MRLPTVAGSAGREASAADPWASPNGGEASEKPEVAHAATLARELLARVAATSAPTSKPGASRTTTARHHQSACRELMRCAPLAARSR